MAYAGVPPVAMGGTLRSTASDMSLSHQTAEPVYQALSMGTVGARDTSAGAPQLYPVSQPGLPPAGPASATLSVYTSGDPSPMVGRGRGRQRLHHAYDYPEASTSDRFSPDVSPIVATSGAGLQPPPNMRQALSTNNAGEYISGAALRHQSSSNLSAQMHSQQGSMNSGYGSSNHSPSMDMQAADAAAAVSTRTSAYNYPEVGYSPKRSTGPYGSQQRTASAAWSDRDHPESAMDMNDSSEGGTADGAAAGSGHARASMSSAGDGVQPHDYTNASMAHIRWNPASSGSPLRQEISVAGQHVAEGSSGTLPLLSVNGPVTQASSSLAHIYGTLPRTSYAMRGTVPDGGAHAQSLAEAQHTAASSPGQQQQQPWPRISPQTIAQQQQHAHSDSPRVQTQTTAGPVADYYMLQSPTEQSFTEPQTPRADATSLLPMVEVGQGAHAPAANNMDEINAHSQEYLHRRRRRLTQTMHNRQRSGSAADPAARLSASRLNAALSMSSPSVHSHGSNRSMEDAHITEQSPYGYQSAQPVSSVYQSMPLSAAAYSGAPSNYTPADSQASMQAHLQAQAQLQAHAQAQLQAQAQAQAQAQLQAQAQAQLQARAQAQAQAEYMQRLQAEQERLQQEQMRQAIEQQQQQQQLQIKLAQEQELLRFRNYRPLLSLTVDIVETYRKCHPEFYYESARRPRRVLTHPSDGVKNDGFDNQNSDYILYVNDVIGEKEGHQYLIMEMLGSGTFGQVVKCQNLKTGDLVAVKVIKNKTAYYNQSMMEVQMLDLLNKKYDIDDRHHILRLKEWFVFRNHLVFVNELLSINLYDLLKQNQYQGLSTNLVRVLVQQILDAMIVLNKAQIIHADLKPENILLEGMEKPVIKVIDFGSACFEWQTTFTYIQSRFYRSPEILLGLPYSSRIDMWSLGCIVAELYLG
ncbi:dual specificity protein kinase yak1, partial [Coemansia sp. RSA 2611]